LDPTQLIADYFGFASPTLTGSWRLDTKAGPWTVFFRGGQIAGLNAPTPDSDLLAFLVDLGQIDHQNLNLLRRAEREGLPPITLLSDLLGGTSELDTGRRKHALYTIGRLFCEGVEGHSFSDAQPPSWAQPLGVDSQATPYVALRLQTPDLLRSAFRENLHRPVKLNRSNRVSVAALNLDREALAIARDLKTSQPLHQLIATSVSAQHAVVVYSVALTLTGAELLTFSGEPEPPSAKPQGISLAMPPTVRPPGSGASVESVSLDVTLDITPGMLTDLDESSQARAPMPPREETRSPVKQIAVAQEPITAPADDVLPPVDTEDTSEAPLVDRGEPSEPPEQTGDLVAFFADLTEKRMHRARAARATLSFEPQLADLVDHYVAICDPQNPSPDEAMMAALSGLQIYLQDAPDRFMGPYLLARIYDRMGNNALANVFHKQALGLAPDEALLNAWSPAQ
jgi:hypothetical protein